MPSHSSKFAILVKISWLDFVHNSLNAINLKIYLALLYFLVQVANREVLDYHSLLSDKLKQPCKPKLLDWKKKDIIPILNSKKENLDCFKKNIFSLMF